MKKLSQSSSGFGQVELVVIVLVIAVVGIGGWFAMQQKNKGNKTTSNTTQYETAKPCPAAEGETTYTGKVGVVDGQSYYTLTTDDGSVYYPRTKTSAQQTTFSNNVGKNLTINATPLSPGSTDLNVGSICE